LTKEHIPKLAPPGAGIPWIARVFLQIYTRPFVAAKSNWDDSKNHFQKISEKIIKEIDGLSEQELMTKILVPRQMGLEDSSRYWSMAMTLEHLVIVGSQIGVAIESLSMGEIPSGEANTAKVKPKGELTAAVAMDEFRNFCFHRHPNLKILNKDSILRFKHPWFGPMTAKEWYWLLPVHHGIHLKQIREIKKRLPVA